MPLPATVVMMPEGLTFRTLLEDPSQMYRFPSLSTVIPLVDGSHVLTAWPPSAELQHLELPATVLMVPWP